MSERTVIQKCIDILNTQPRLSWWERLLFTAEPLLRRFVTKILPNGVF